MPERRKFQQPSPLSHDEVIARVATRDPELGADALAAVGLYEEDYGFAASVIVEGARASDRVIRGAALIAFAHLARRFRRVPEEAYKMVPDALGDPDEYIRGQAETAADDIDHHVAESRGRLVRPDGGDCLGPSSSSPASTAGGRRPRRHAGDESEAEMQVTRIFPVADRNVLIVHLTSFDWDVSLGTRVKLVQGSNVIEAKQIGSGNHEGHATVTLTTVGTWEDMMESLRKMEAAGQAMSIEHV